MSILAKALSQIVGKIRASDYDLIVQDLTRIDIDLNGKISNSLLTNSILGRFSAGTGPLERLAVGNGLEIVNVGGVFTLRLSAGYATQSVASITSPTVAEGATMIFNISLSGATAQVQQFPFTLAGTATPGTDYATPLVFSNGVTISGTNLSIPIGVSSFTASTLTSTDALVEPTETVILTIGGITGTGSILDVQASGVTWDGGASTWDGGTTIWTS